MAEAAPLDEVTAIPAPALRGGAPIMTRPYPPSWLNWVTDRIAGLPIPAPAVYVGFAVVMVIVANSEDWFAGITTFPALAPELTYWGLLAAALLALVPYLDRVATSALEAFKPALEGAPIDLAALEYELTVIPARPALLVTGVAVAAILTGFITNPVGSGVAGLPPVAMLITAVGWSLTLGLVAVLMYHTVRQLRAVSRIHAIAPNVNLFRLAPLYAFSQLTVRTSIAFIAIVATTVLVDAPAFENWPLVITVPFLVGGIGVATAAFVVPLQGMHRRLTAEKKDLEWQVGQRLQAAISEIHRAADAHDLSQADGLSKQLNSLIAENDVVAKLPTWPWHPGTVGVFVSAILLPVGLYVVTRLLQRVV